MDVVHIVNGDVSASKVGESGLKGDIIVWREMLCDGPLHENVATPAFYSVRSKWFREQPVLRQFDYDKISVPELSRLHDLGRYEEVVLWFDYSLFCQVNLLAAGSALYRDFDAGRRYSLICTGPSPGSRSLQAMNDYSLEEFVLLFGTRSFLDEIDLKFLDRVWALFVRSDSHQLYFLPEYHKYPYLKPAMHQHIYRSVVDQEGLCEIARQILIFVESGIRTMNNLIHALLNWQREEALYGFSDVQYEMEIHKLEAVIRQRYPGFIWKRS